MDMNTSSERLSAPREQPPVSREWSLLLFGLFFVLLACGIFLGQVFETYHNASTL